MTNPRICALFILLSLFALSSAASIQAQEPNDAESSQFVTGLPMRSPGYDLYYHNDTGPQAFATRWGYHDGWTDGRRDRNFGRAKQGTDQDKYKVAPDHGMHPSLDRSTYKSLYRTAYLRGYTQGSKM